MANKKGYRKNKKGNSPKAGDTWQKLDTSDGVYDGQIGKKDSTYRGQPRNPTGKSYNQFK